jgi:hypothetical protein
MCCDLPESAICAIARGSEESLQLSRSVLKIITRNGDIILSPRGCRVGAASSRTRKAVSENRGNRSGHGKPSLISSCHTALLEPSRSSSKKREVRATVKAHH